MCMDTIRKLIPKVVGILTAAALLIGLSGNVLAFDSGTAGDDTAITMYAGENTFTYDVKLSNIEKPFASAQFDIKVGDVNGVKATGVSFKKSIRDKASGTVNTILSGWEADGNQVTYTAGFFSTENQYEGELTIGTISFSYLSNTPQTITLSNLEIIRFTGNIVEGVPELEKTTESWSKTITVSRSAITPKVEAPTANPSSGTYNSARQVTLSSATAGAKIYYTLDSSEPSRLSMLYSSTITVNKSMIIKAFAVKDGYNDSAVAAFTYVISNGGTVTPKVEAPTAAPSSGAYNSAIQVTLSSATAWAKIYYTIDSSEPSRLSTLYSGPITVDKSMTIKAFAVKDSYSDSTTATFTYTISNRATGGTDETEIGAEQPPAATVNFKDVGAVYAWAKDAINGLAARGVIVGDNFGNFMPANNVTRADFVVMISKLVDLGPAGNMKFSDVPSGRYYTDAINKASEAGIISGTGNGKFSPQQSILRQDAFVIIYRLLDRLGKTDGTGASISAFGDASNVSSYAQQAVSFLVGKGIVKGSNGLLNPKLNITRAEAAVILYKIAVMFNL